MGKTHRTGRMFIIVRGSNEREYTKHFANAVLDHFITYFRSIFSFYQRAEIFPPGNE